MNRFSLIIADDELTIRTGLSNAVDWDQLGFQVVGCYADGRDVIAHLMREPVDAVLTDIVMSHVSGVETARWIYENRPDTQVVLLSGYSDFGNAQQAIAYGVKRYLLKPTNIDELIDTFKHIARQLELNALLKQRENARVNTLISHVAKLMMSTQLKSPELIPIVRELFRDDSILILVRYDRDTASLPIYKGGIAIPTAGDRYRLYLTNKCGCPALESALEPHAQLLVRIDSPEALLHELTMLLRYDVIDNNSVQEQLFLAQLQQLLDEQEYECLPDFFDKALNDEMPRSALLIGAYKAEARFATLCTQLGVPLSMGSESDALLPLLADDAGAPQLIEWARHLAVSYARLHQRMSNQLLQTINEWLQRNLSSGVTLQAAATQVYMSPNYLSRIFKEAAGETFSNYVFRYKMEYAQQMLLNSDAKVFEIGAQIGYRDTRYFIKVFKAHTGMSPAEYRRKLRRNAGNPAHNS